MEKQNMRIFAIWLCALGCLASLGCTQPDAPRYLYGHNLTLVELHLTSDQMGIHPDTSILENENNPFRHGAVGDETKWVLNDEASAVSGFYSWATQLAYSPRASTSTTPR